MGQETWPGGYVHRDARGRPTYVIRRRFGDRRITVSTRRQTLQAAMVELARFELDPEGYAPLEAGKVELSDALAVEFLNWSRDERGNSPAWLLDKKRALAWWMDQLGGADLRKVAVSRFHEALEDTPGARAKIETIKHLYAFLIKKGRIRQTEDPTFRVLTVPPARPEQWDRDKAMTPEAHRVWLQVLPAPWRAVIVVLSATGWHVKEAERFSKAGVIEGNVLRCPKAKRGNPLNSQVPEEVLPAAEVLRARGGFRNDVLINTLRRLEQRHAARGVPLPKLDPGSYRHTFATAAFNAGADASSVMLYMNHANIETTRRYYATNIVPPRPKGI